jgi:hypothetical protein
VGVDRRPGREHSQLLASGILAEADPVGLIADGATRDAHAAEVDAVPELKGPPALTDVTEEMASTVGGGSRPHPTVSGGHFAKSGRTRVPSSRTAFSEPGSSPRSRRIVGAIWVVSTGIVTVWPPKLGVTPAPLTTIGTSRS